MPTAACTIVVDRLPDGRFRATCHMLPDAESVAASEAEAKAGIERALEHFIRQRAEQPATNPIDVLFRELRATGRKAFMPFITAGDPDLATTSLCVKKLIDAGASLVEIGFPYSDPIADGPVIQASYSRALDRGLKVDDIFTWAKGQSEKSSVPLIGMVSYSLVHRRGAEAFLAQTKQAGFAGLIVPDLPIDEAENLTQLAALQNLALIQLVTPTTPPARAARIVRYSTGFVYCVSITGITGERDRLPESLLDQLRWLRGQTDLPLCVGFGVSRPEHVHMLRDHADGIIVGSALVRKLEQAGRKPPETIAAEIGELARQLATALNPTV